MRSLPINPEEMRLFEVGARESPYASRSPSPTCQNVTNQLDEACFRPHYVSSANLKSAYLIVSLALYSFFTALSLVYVEWLAADPISGKEEEEADARRGEFLRRFARFQYYLPVESTEWAASTKDLLGWYERQLYDDSEPDQLKWNLSSAVALAGAVGSTIGRLPGKRLIACQRVSSVQFFRPGAWPPHERRPPIAPPLVTVGHRAILLLRVVDGESVLSAARPLADDRCHQLALHRHRLRFHGGAALGRKLLLNSDGIRRPIDDRQPIIGGLPAGTVALRLRLFALALLLLDLRPRVRPPPQLLEAVGLRARRRFTAP